MPATCKRYEEQGRLTTRNNLPDSVFAFSHQRKEPVTDARHVRNAIARFDRVIDASDQERDLAFANIKKAADYYAVEMTESSWRELGRTPHSGQTAAHRKHSEYRAAETRQRREG
jgi:hypothetical protein